MNIGEGAGGLDIAIVEWDALSLAGEGCLLLKYGMSLYDWEQTQRMRRVV